MANEKMVKVDEAVCYWLVYGQAYLANVDAVYADQVNAAGGATVDLTYGGILKAYHVPYDPSGQPHSYCRSDDPGWAGSLPKNTPAGKIEETTPAEPEPTKPAPAKPEIAEEAEEPKTVTATASASKRTPPR